MKYKLIALDLDGTLNTDDKTITPKTRDALLKACLLYTSDAADE